MQHAADTTPFGLTELSIYIDNIVWTSKICNDNNHFHYIYISGFSPHNGSLVFDIRPVFTGFWTTNLALRALACSPLLQFGKP